MKKDPVIGLALGSGGARGWCHIGVLEALDEMGVRPGVVAGTSMGALVGVAWASGRLDALRDWVLELTPRRFFGLIDPRFKGGLVEAQEITRMLEDIGVPERLEDLDLPFTAVATDMRTGREIWFDSGPTYPAIRASVGIPGVMTPTWHEDMWLLDGGLVNPVPVSAVFAKRAEIIIAVNPNATRPGRTWEEQPTEDEGGTGWTKVLPEAIAEALNIDADAESRAAPNYFTVLNASIDIMTEQIRRARFAGEPPHVVLDAAFDDLTVLELFRGKEAIAEGRRMVEARADRIAEVCRL
ncbi:patatin-like phospholipase family protein [Maritimibacter sp. UBA3975]|uniref:patatin-like phospholipase family protein n=1 Tax=Maritimibacter sp. UBA3975 TaxID=1946833 RepID=UPI000C09421B|nr:patatin-like phospholipase family protein [Maritimibacter sp. UBA3975]MAM62394.1 patatin [Maritimibacter sp.]|tara:strand:- start:13384 stop:14274 length:891 start_codon:yes stop_codon:yes gene_type:complete